jgi:ribulose-phosphate 3-epimerase
VQRIKDLGRRAGVAVNPATPAAMLEEILPEVDLVLVMTVNPGFGGQSFLSGTLPKIRKVRQIIDALGSGCELEVDGGIDHDSASLVVQAGANVLVAGSSIYGAPEGAAEALRQLQERADRSMHYDSHPEP